MPKLKQALEALDDMLLLEPKKEKWELYSAELPTPLGIVMAQALLLMLHRRHGGIFELKGVDRTDDGQVVLKWSNDFRVMRLLAIYIDSDGYFSFIAGDYPEAGVSRPKHHDLLAGLQDAMKMVVEFTKYPRTV
jgi:hypothetical protein